jgi:ankyrin repeat protein
MANKLRFLGNMQRLKRKVQAKLSNLRKVVALKKLSNAQSNKSLLRKKKSNLALHKAVIKGDIDKVTELLNHNHQIINQRDLWFRTALDYAIWMRDIEIISDLVLLGGRVAMTFYNCLNDREFVCALHLLDQAKYNFNKLDILGFAPIHYASSQGFRESITFLLKCKVDVNLRSVHGETAIKYALRQHRSGIIAGDC